MPNEEERQVTDRRAHKKEVDRRAVVRCCGKLVKRAADLRPHADQLMEPSRIAQQRVVMDKSGR